MTLDTQIYRVRFVDAGGRVNTKFIHAISVNDAKRIVREWHGEGIDILSCRKIGDGRE